MERGVPIRAVTRALAVLSAVNRAGSATMMEISKSAAIPYPTACRIVQTLLHEGMIEREYARKRYRATALVQTLSVGFQAEDELVFAARPHLESLCHEIKWPISLATRVGTRMMVRDSTHKLTSLTFSNYYPGFTLPIAECATGKAYLTFCSEVERETIVEGWRATDNETSRHGLLIVHDNDVLEKIRLDGYAYQARNLYNAEPGKTSSLAVPVYGQDGVLVGSLAVIYFASALKTDPAVHEFLGPLQATAAAIHEALKRSR
jgi:IclR family transcriptional regulator, mhp operon transcriptional activator